MTKSEKRHYMSSLKQGDCDDARETTAFYSEHIIDFKDRQMTPCFKNGFGKVVFLILLKYHVVAV